MGPPKPGHKLLAWAEHKKTKYGRGNIVIRRRYVWSSLTQGHLGDQIYYPKHVYHLFVFRGFQRNWYLNNFGKDALRNRQLNMRGHRVTSATKLITQSIFIIFWCFEASNAIDVSNNVDADRQQTCSFRFMIMIMNEIETSAPCVSSSSCYCSGWLP